MAEEGPGTTPSQAAVELARRVLEGNPKDEEAGTTRKRRAGSCLVVFHRKADGSACVDSPEGPLPVDPEELAAVVREGARTLEVRDIEGAGECPAIQLGKKGRVAKEDRDPPIPPETREAVVSRDGYRCVICGGSEGLTVHHLDSHANGGKGTMERTACLCRRCQAAAHTGDIVLRVDEGRVTARDRDGEVVTDFGRLSPPAVNPEHVVVRDAPEAPDEVRVLECGTGVAGVERSTADADRALAHVVHERDGVAGEAGALRGPRGPRGREARDRHRVAP